MQKSSTLFYFMMLQGLEDSRTKMKQHITNLFVEEMVCKLFMS